MGARLFRVGDRVWLNFKNVKLLRPCKKLDFKNGGPFEITECVGKYAYKLKLPPSMKIHPVFHVSLLRATANDPLPGQTSGPPPVVEAEDNDPEYEVEKIIGSHWVDGSLHYLVRWKGYGPEDDWSIPATQAGSFEALVRQFHELNPSEPKPTDVPSIAKPRKQKKKPPRGSSARLARG